ncbi:MAG TPA: hypothetical protein VF331_05110 [Polyangiales bacterium]
MKDAGTDSGAADSGTTAATDSGTASTTIMCGTKTCMTPTLTAPGRS